MTSPTFTIVHEYEGRYPILHMDVYRLDSFQEVLDLGFEELLRSRGDAGIEWGEAVAPLLPRRYLGVEIGHGSIEDEDETRGCRSAPRVRSGREARESMKRPAETLLSAASDETRRPSGSASCRCHRHATIGVGS